MIILAALLYSVLASGGYLDSFGSFGNYTSGLFNFNFLDSDATTPRSVPSPLIPVKPKKIPLVNHKINTKRQLHMRHFNNGYLQTQNSKRRGRFNVRTTTRPSKTQIASRARATVKTKTRSITTAIPLTTRNISTTESILSTDGSLFMEIFAEIVTSRNQKRNVNQTTTDIPLPVQSTYVTKYIEKCPDEGYFFKRDLQGSSDRCYLCFCQGNGTAICWERNNKKCNAESYHHNWPKKRVSRTRRSPISFGDLFMQDATKNVFNAQSQKSCKPGEGSYSEGCPPLDWCVGCTVCDCNSAGKWDCHLLSFCTDVKNNKNNKNKNKNEKGELQGHFYDPFEKPKVQRAERQKTQREVQDLAERLAQQRQKKKIGKSNTRRYVFKNGTLVNKTLFDLRKRKKSPTIIDQSSAEVQKWSNLNMKIRKIPDQMTRQKLIDKQHSNARKVSESANFFVRKMPNKKTKQIIDKKHSQAVNILAKRQPNRKKKRQVILPSGVKLPKELIDKLPPGVLPPTRDPPGEHFPKKSHVKRVLPNQMAATKPPRQMIVKRSLELSSELLDKKMVKRSTNLNNKPKPTRTKIKENKDHGRKKVTASNKKTNLSRTKKASLKEKAKKRSVKITHSKIPQKTNSKRNNEVKNKKNLRKNSTSKNKTKTKGKNHTNKNMPSKRKNTVKSSPKKLRKSLKTNHDTNRKHNNKKTTVSKKILKKGKKNNSNVRVNKNIKNKKVNKKEIKRRSIITKNKGHVTKTSKNKQINKAKKGKLNKTKENKNHIRGKRSDSVQWVKTVTEGSKVTKFAAVAIKSVPNNNQNSTKKPRKLSPQEEMAQIKRRKLNEVVQKLTENIQDNLNRKVLEAVGKMLGQDLSPKSNKVNRSAVLKMANANENVSNKADIDLMALNPNKFYQNQNLDVANVPDRKESQPYSEYFGQRIKRSPNNNEGYNESRHIPFIVKKRPLPPVKHIEKREVVTNQIEERFTSKSPPTNQTSKAFKELDKYLESAMFTTQSYLTTDIKRSVPLSTPERTGDSDLEDIHIPIKKTARNFVDNNTASRGNNLKLSVPLMVNRLKRSEDFVQPVRTDLQKFENEIFTNSFHNITSTHKNLETSDSISKYYKYTVDDYLENNTEPAVKNYVTEVVEVYTKNIAAKRSVDKQIERFPNVTGSIMAVQGLSDKNIDSSIVSPQLLEKKMVVDNDENLKVHAVQLPTFNPIDVLDDKVVIIYDQNVSSIENVSVLTTNSLPHPTITSDLKPRIINNTVLGIKDSQSTEKDIQTEGLNKIKTNEIIDISNTIVDKSVVIIHDQNTTTIPFIGSNFTTTTEYNINSKLGDSIDILAIKESALITKTDTKQNTSSIEQQTSTSFKVDTRGVNVSAKLSTEERILSTENIKADDYLVVRENDFKPNIMSKLLQDDINKYKLKPITKTDINSKFEVHDKVTKQAISVIDIDSQESGVISTTVITSTERLKPKVKNYLNFDINMKKSDMKQNYVKQRKHKKVKKIMNPEKNSMTLTEKLKPKHSIDDFVVILVQKDPYINVLENISQANNVSILPIDFNMTNNNVLPTKKSNTIEQGNSITNSILEFTKHMFTTQIVESTYSTEVSPVLQEEIQKNHSKSKSEVYKVKTYDIKRLSTKNANKHKLKKILSTLHNKTDKDERYLINDIVKNERNLNINKTNDLKSFFKKLLGNFKFNKHARKPSNVKRFKILKYLQKFFKKIFSDDGKNKRNKTLAHQLNRKTIIETLCSSFGPCNINVKNKAKLQSQIDHLNSETYKMLRSVKIIKGLLKLVDIAQNDKKLNNGTLKSNFKSDVQKLHAILRDTYSNPDEIDKLTETQRIQIQYIKNNTQNFIQSAAKFTMVLNEIINIITLQDHLKIEKGSQKLKEIEDIPTIQRKEELTNIKKIFKSPSNNKTETVTESSESLQKLRELISKYSLIQNTFMRKIYNVLTRLDSKENVQKEIRAADETIDTKFHQHQNKTEEIQVYTKNIIQNLRKLKDLAQSLNGDTGHVRRKRDLRNDDSLEYMLMLMEYLIKQQRPLDDAPVNDGIDLLIEAIKSAPNIKTIKKKVLPAYKNYSTKLPTKYPPTKITFKARNTSKSDESEEIKQSKDVSSESDSKPSKEENVTSSKLEEPKFNLIDQSIDDDAEDQDYYMYNRRSQPSSTIQMTSPTEGRTQSKWHEEVTTDVFYNTIADSEVSTKSKSHQSTKNHAYRVMTYDLFNRYGEEEVSSTNTVAEIDNTSGTTATESTTKADIITKSTESTPLAQMRRYNNDDVSANKFRIDWLDETYEEEIKEPHRTSPAPAKTTKHTQLYQVSKDTENVNETKYPIKPEDVSGQSKEEEKETKKPATTVKDIMYKKDMLLLNSLDYGTEKSEMDVSASIESGNRDKYSGDTYFREERI